MLDIIGKSLSAGVGMMSLTRKKAQAFVDGLVNRGEAKREDAQKLVDELVARGEEERTAFQKLVHDEVKKVLDSMSLATKDDMDALGRKVDALIHKVKKD